MAKAHIGLGNLSLARTHLDAIDRRIEAGVIEMESLITPQYFLNRCEYWLAAGDFDQARQAAARLHGYGGSAGSPICASHSSMSGSRWRREYAKARFSCPRRSQLFASTSFHGQRVECTTRPRIFTTASERWRKRSSADTVPARLSDCWQIPSSKVTLCDRRSFLPERPELNRRTNRKSECNVLARINREIRRCPAALSWAAGSFHGETCWTPDRPPCEGA